MGRAILVWCIGCPLAFVAAFAITALVNTGQLNPQVSQEQYIHLRGIAFLLFFAFCGVVGFLAAKCIHSDLRK